MIAKISRCFFVVVLLLAAIAVGRFFAFPSPRTSATEIVGELPKSARLGEAEFLKYGFDDVTYLFVFHCTGPELRRRLQEKWKLKSVEEVHSVEAGFAPKDRPHWWPSGTHAYFRSDDKISQYWLVWEVAVPGELYVAVGTW